MLKNTGTFILLKKVKYAESDLILTALSPEGAKKSFLARGALNSKKRFSGGLLEPLNHVKLTYTDKTDKDQLSILDEAQLLNDFSGLKKDYDILQFSLICLDAIYRVSQEGDLQSESVYNLLGHTLKNLSSGNLDLPKDLIVLKYQFYLKFLAQQGVLSVEPWMKVFVQSPLSNFKNLSGNLNSDLPTVSYIESLLKNYIENAHIGT